MVTGANTNSKVSDAQYCLEVCQLLRMTFSWNRTIGIIFSCSLQTAAACLVIPRAVCVVCIYIHVHRSPVCGVWCVVCGVWCVVCVCVCLCNVRLSNLSVYVWCSCLCVQSVHIPHHVQCWTHQTYCCVCINKNRMTHAVCNVCGPSYHLFCLTCVCVPPTCPTHWELLYVFANTKHTHSYTCVTCSYLIPPTGEPPS